MYGSLKVNPDELDSLASLLDSTSSGIDTATHPSLDAGRVGHRSVADALDHLATNWNYRRRDLTERIGTLSTMVRSAATAYRAVDQAIVDACGPGSTGDARPTAAQAAQASTLTSIQSLRVDGSPGAPASWADGDALWAAMTPAQREAFLRSADIDAVGNDDRYPPEVRDAANRVRVEQERQRLLMRQPRTASEQKRLDLCTRVLGNQDHVQILLFDPTGDGKMAVVHGNLSTATNVSVDVPGISNSLDTFGGLMDDGARLRGVPGQPGGTGPDSAVVTWLGYDTPVAITDVGNIGQIVTKDMAATGAKSLQSFVAGINANNPGAQVTVIGHSYGSLVTGMAAQLPGGLGADRVVFIGSPGVGATSVADLHLNPGAQVIAISNHQTRSVFDTVVSVAVPGAVVVDHLLESDYVTDAGRIFSYLPGSFGTVPVDPSFGATVIDVGSSPGFGNQHAYYEPGSRSLAQLQAIVRGDAVAGSSGW